MGKHNDIIPASPCDGTLSIVRHGVYENVGWTVWRCCKCEKTVREYNPLSGLENAESDS